MPTETAVRRGAQRVLDKLPPWRSEPRKTSGELNLPTAKPLTKTWPLSPTRFHAQCRDFQMPPPPLRTSFAADCSHNGRHRTGATMPHVQGREVRTV